MPTFLTTRRMAPALAARIEKSVGGPRPRDGGTATLRRFVSVFRLVTLVLSVLAAAVLLQLRHRERDALERSRAALLERVRARAASLPPDDRKPLRRIEPWLVRGSGQYEGDLVAPELREPGTLGSFLSRPLVYVRGPMSEFSGPAGIGTTAATSLKDALLLCLLSPPSSRTESAVLTKVHGAYGGGARLEARTANVRRLHELEAGLPFLEPAWEAKVRAAADLSELVRLERAFDAAPVEPALKAAAARLLLYVMDEPGEGRGPAELDGERPHDVRVGLVDLGAQRPLLRLRRPVDPGWISIPNRPQYASGLDSCLLALDVHASVAGS